MTRQLLLLILLLITLVGCGSAAALEAPPPFVVETGVDSEEWALVPAGEFLMGLNANTIDVRSDYEMMVTDVTNAQYAAYLNEALATGTVSIQDNQVMGFYPGDDFHGYNHELEIEAGEWRHVPLDHKGLRFVYDGEQFTAAPGYENHPAVLVTWFGAQAYCHFYGWRLPTEVEWEKAARGPDGLPYPWGHDLDRNNANYYSSHDLFEKIAGKLGDTTPVGFFNGRTYNGYQTQDSPSPYGLYDMAGNVWQWTGDVYEDTHLRYMRGGSKADYGYNLRAWTRNSAAPDYYSVNVGFRCARDQ